MNAKVSSSKIDSLMLANGKYAISISEKNGNYLVNLSKIDEQKKEEVKPTLKIATDEPKRGRGRPKMFKPQPLEVVKDEPVQEVKRNRGRPHKIEQTTEPLLAKPQVEEIKMEEKRKRGRPSKQNIIMETKSIEPPKRGRGRPKKIA